MGIFHRRNSPQARRIVWGTPQGSASKIGPTAATSAAAPLPEPGGPTEKVQRRSNGVCLVLAGLQGLPSCGRCAWGCCRCRRLSLSQEAANFIFSGKLGQDGSVSQHTPGGRRKRAMWCLRPEEHKASLLPALCHCMDYMLACLLTDWDGGVSHSPGWPSVSTS